MRSFKYPFCTILIMPYKFLEGITTADVAFEATGTLEEVFENAAIAVAEVQVEIKTVKTAEKSHIDLERDDLSELLHDFLEELVFIKDTEQLLFVKAKVKITKKKTYKLEADLIGDHIKQDEQTMGTDVKAVTMHKFELKEVKKGKWRAQVVLDI